jgi:aspartate ammonia-lyase
MRTETDTLGQITLEDTCYYGIATERARRNFSTKTKPVHPRIIEELVNIKKQAAVANKQLGYLDPVIADAILAAAERVFCGEFNDAFCLDSYQGGAGTSINMNVNEVLANVALEELGKPLGDYQTVHPINHVNLHQSTNDTVPTAIKVAAIKCIRLLADELAKLQQELQAKEDEFGSILQLGRTQLMDAVPMLAGQRFGAFAQAISRDRWRIYKGEERLRRINIGGTAIGTGLNAPIKYTFLMTALLQESTNIGVSRADNLIDNTQNLDCFVEVSGLLKTCATNLIKIANDLRFLSSGPHGGIGEIILPPVQTGSSIMPGKINPVILEHTVQVGEQVIANDGLITNLVARGQLELNPFLPLIGETLLSSLDLLTSVIGTLRKKCIKGLNIDQEKCLYHLEQSCSLITPLISILGYDQASEIVKSAQENHRTIKQELLEKKLFTKEQLDKMLDPINITSPGKVERE